jgi:hypothetical protein
MKVPSAKELYSEENLIYGASRVSKNPKAGYYKPKAPKAESVIKMIAYGLGEKILRRSPTASSDSVIGGVYNSLRNGLIQTFNAGKHNEGQRAFENTIPGLKKVIQNLYSFYQLKNGVTTLDEVYTVKWNDVNGNGNAAKEYLLAVHGEKESAMSVDILRTLASRLVGNNLACREQRDNIRRVMESDKYGYKEAINAGVYQELTDKDILSPKIMDIQKVPPLYQKAELALFGEKGKKEVAATGTANGHDYTIYRYGKPSTADFWKFYAELDLLYSATGITAGAAERLLKGIGAQRIYLTEITNVLNSSLNRYGGSMNPLSFSYQY